MSRTPFAARLLQSATLAGRIDVIEWLLDNGAAANTPWHLPDPVIGGALELVFFVTALCAARMTRHSEITALLLRRGARQDVFTAAFLRDLPVVQRLVSERASLAQVPDPATDALTITPIHHSVAGNQVPALRDLPDHATEPVRTGARALRAAAQRGSQKMIELLLEHGADAHALDDRGRTAIDWLGQAAKSVDRDAVRDELKGASRPR